MMKQCYIDISNRPSQHAPNEQAGAKIPPAPPLAYEQIVAANFSTQRPIMTLARRDPDRASARVGYPPPVIPRCFSPQSASTAKIPVNIPPIAGCTHFGTNVNCLNHARNPSSESVNVTETTAERRP